MSSQRYQMPLVPLLALAALTAGCAADGSTTPEPTDPAATPSAEATTPTPELEDPTPPSNSSTNPKVLDCTSEFIGGTGCDYDCSVSGDVLTSGDITITSTDSGTINVQGSDFDDDIKVETQGGDWLYVIDNTFLDNNGEGCVLGIYDQTKITSFTATGNSGDDIIDCDDDGLTIPVILNGNPGDDILKGGPMADTIRGHGDTDTLYGNGGADFLYGTGSATTTDGFADVIYGHDADSVGPVAEGICENEADGDIIYCYGYLDPVLYDCSESGHSFNHNCSRDGDVLTTDNLTITTSPDGSVYIEGSANAEHIYLEAVVDGTYGALVGIYDYNSPQVNQPVLALDPSVLSGLTVQALQGDDTVDCSNADLDIPLTLYGHAGDDILIGSDGDDILMGGTDNDQLYGMGGSDALYGRLDTNDDDDAVDTLYGYNESDPGSEADTCAYSNQSPSDYTFCYPDVLYPNRDARALETTIDDAFSRLVGGRGPEVNGVKEYTLNNHVQSMVYTGPFTNGSGALWHSRSDALESWETYEVRFNHVDPNDQDLNGGMEQDNGNDLSEGGNIEIGSEDHVSQIEWLPDYGAQAGGDYTGGYVFITAEERGELHIYYFDSTDESRTELTDSSTRLELHDTSETMNQVYITKRSGLYWLVLGNKSYFELYTAPQEALFPAGSEAGGQLDVTAFEYQGTVSSGGGTGGLCEFVTDVSGTLYRLCYYNADSDNCDNGDDNDNWVYANKVTTFVDSSANPTLSFANSSSYSVNLGNWGGDGNCSDSTAECKWLEKPSFRAAGSHYVGSDGVLQIYGMAYGGKDSPDMCTYTTEASKARTQVYTAL